MSDWVISRENEAKGSAQRALSGGGLSSRWLGGGAVGGLATIEIGPDPQHCQKPSQVHGSWDSHVLFLSGAPCRETDASLASEDSREPSLPLDSGSITSIHAREESSHHTPSPPPFAHAFS